MKCFKKFLVLSTLMLLAPAAAWADRAVIIGVGKYEFKGIIGEGNVHCAGYAVCPIPDLQGIGRDVAIMGKLLNGFGVQREDIRVLLDAEASLESVQDAIEWLLAAGPSERAWFYYSGHGSQIRDEDGDEEDGADEILVLHDARFDAQGRPTGGVLVDDWFAARLRSASAREIFVLVDACNSGTVTKAMPDPLGVHSWKRYIPVPLGDLPARSATAGASQFVDTKSLRPVPHVALSAVEDFQLAPATANGSPFTIALDQVISGARAERTRLSPKQVRDKVAKVLSDAGYSNASVNPQVSGDPVLADRPLPLGLAPGPRWSKLEQIVAQSTPGAVTIDVTRQSYSVRNADALELTVDLKGEAYLWVFSVDHADDAVLLLPNSWVEEIKLPAGKHRIPVDVKLDRPERNLRFLPSAPGETFVVVVATPEKLKLPDDMRVSKSADLNFISLSTAAADAILRQLAGTRKQFAAVVAEDLANGPITRPQATGVVVNVTP